MNKHEQTFWSFCSEMVLVYPSNCSMLWPHGTSHTGSNGFSFIDAFSFPWLWRRAITGKTIKGKGPTNTYARNIDKHQGEDLNKNAHQPMLNISPYLCVSQMFRTCFWDQSCFWVQFLHWTRPITRSKQEVVFYGFCPGFWHPSVQPSFAHECQFGPCFIAKVAFFEIKPVHFKGISHCPFFVGMFLYVSVPGAAWLQLQCPPYVPWTSQRMPSMAMTGWEVLGWHRGTPPTNG